MGAFDCIDGEIECLQCGEIIPDNINLQVKFIKKPMCNFYGIGDYIDCYTKVYDYIGHIVNMPEDKTTFSFIETPECCCARNWVLVRIEKNIITEIQSIELTQENIQDVNYLSDQIWLVGLDFKDGNLVPCEGVEENLSDDREDIDKLNHIVKDYTVLKEDFRMYDVKDIHISYHGHNKTRESTVQKDKCKLITAIVWYDDNLLRMYFGNSLESIEVSPEYLIFSLECNEFVPAKTLKPCEKVLL